MSGWPDKPYRGLNYLRREDRPLLAGREADVVACAELVAHPETRVLLLHGSTGSGKSSFLRAGLIPTLEEEGAGYLFLRLPGVDDEALFIRCTAAPIDQIARHLYLFASRPFRLRTPSGWREIDLGAARLGAANWEAYLQEVQRGGDEGLVRSLAAIADAIPQTMVLIVDQAEEVLTLNPGPEGIENRALFFEFLRDLQRTRIDARILVAFRTEYFGRFLDAVQVSHRSGAGFRQFFLNELPAPALEEAILRPTLREKVLPWGVPHDVYSFSFDPGLPARITQDVLSARYSGPALPVLQLVCLGLYDGLRMRNADTITEADYSSTGEVQGQIVTHVQRSLGTALEDEARARQIRTFLAGFYFMQDDGSVVARTRSVDWARKELAPIVSPHAAEDLLHRLARAETLVLRQLRSVRSDGLIIDELTLGHDSIALAVERWRALDAEKRAQERQTQDKKDWRITKGLYVAGLVAVAIAGTVSSAARHEIILILFTRVFSNVAGWFEQMPFIKEWLFTRIISNTIAGIIQLVVFLLVAILYPLGGIFVSLKLARRRSRGELVSFFHERGRKV